MSKVLSPPVKLLINEAARKCFGNLPVVNYRTGMKLLRQKPVGPMAANYYIPKYENIIKAAVPGFTTEIEQRRLDALDKLRRRNKGPPKKGQGKRSKKK